MLKRHNANSSKKARACSAPKTTHAHVDSLSAWVFFYAHVCQSAQDGVY